MFTQTILHFFFSSILTADTLLFKLLLVDSLTNMILYENTVLQIFNLNDYQCTSEREKKVGARRTKTWEAQSSQKKTLHFVTAN